MRNAVCPLVVFRDREKLVGCCCCLEKTPTRTKKTQKISVTCLAIHEVRILVSHIYFCSAFGCLQIPESVYDDGENIDKQMKNVSLMLRKNLLY